MSAKIQEYRDILERQLVDKSKPWTKYFDKFEAQTGVSRVYACIGLVAFIGLYLVFGFGAELICNSIAVVYPAYMSMRALESPQKDDDTKWLTYWVVYACFSLVEYFSDFIVGWFPFYWLLKCIFVIWLYLPTDYNGSLILYHRVIKPSYQKYHTRIEEVASSGFKLRRVSHERDELAEGVKELVLKAKAKVEGSIQKLDKKDTSDEDKKHPRSEDEKKVFE